MLARDGHTCQYCGDYATQVHHLRHGYDLCDPHDLISVCRVCHDRVHGIVYTPAPLEGNPLGLWGSCVMLAAIFALLALSIFVVGFVVAR